MGDPWKAVFLRPPEDQVPFFILNIAYKASGCQQEALLPTGRVIHISLSGVHLKAKDVRSDQTGVKP